MGEGRVGALRHTERSVKSRYSQSPQLLAENPVGPPTRGELARKAKVGLDGQHL